MALFDADGDMASGRFVDDVEAVRSGTILAHDQKAYNKWKVDVARRTGRKSGKDLAQLAKDFGGQVVQGDFEFRH